MNEEFIKRLEEIVEQNLVIENFNVEDFANEMNMSESNLRRKLKAKCSKTPIQFIREYRLEKAKEFLLNNESTISEIAYKVGFASPTYFNKCFHEHFGCTPGEFKNHESAATSSEIQKKGKKKLRFLLLTILILVLLVSGAYFTLKDGLTPISASKNSSSVAVVPISYLGTHPDFQHFTDGLCEALLLELSKVENLRVVSGNMGSKLNDDSQTAKEFGRKFRVSYVLKGSLQDQDNQFRLTVHLIQTKDESVVWSKEFDRQPSDYFKVQSEIAGEIAGELIPILIPSLLKEK